MAGVSTWPPMNPGASARSEATVMRMTSGCSSRGREQEVDARSSVAPSATATVRASERLGVIRSGISLSGEMSLFILRAFNGEEAHYKDGYRAIQRDEKPE